MMELLILSKRRRRTQTRQIKTINHDMTGGGRGDETENSVTLERDDTGDKVKVDSKDINTVNSRENSKFNQPQVSTTTASSGFKEKSNSKSKSFDFTLSTYRLVTWTMEFEIGLCSETLELDFGLGFNN